MTLVNAVKEGKIREERGDDAVTRILTVKQDMGLFDDPYLNKVSKEVNELEVKNIESLPNNWLKSLGTT